MKKFILIAVSIFISLLLLEIGLRIFSFKPGVYDTHQGITPVDSLIVFKNFTTDEKGIYKFSSWVIDSFPKYASKKRGEIIHPELEAALASIDNIDCIYFDFMKIATPDCCENLTLCFKCNRLLNNQESELNRAYQKELLSSDKNEWKNALIDYIHQPYNQEGFRSIAFKKYKGNKKKVLIIGDSFVYGMSAMPFHKSFTDNLLARGIMVYSAGIPGTDPAQYAAIAEKYIPMLQPDLVILCFYEGNDYMVSYREPLPHRPHEHLTNAGFFQSNPTGSYLNPNEAYQYYLSQIKVPEQSAFIFSHTVIGAMLWKLFFALNWVKHPAIEKHNVALQQLYAVSQRTDITHRYLNRFNLACKQNNVAVKYVIIPDNGLPHNLNQEYCTIDTLLAQASFKDTPYLFPKNLHPKHHFASTDYHFNNKGSKVFADYLEKLIYNTQPAL